MPPHGQGCRLIWFPAPSAEIKASELFQAFTGEEPDVVRKNKNPSPSNPMTFTAEGDVEEFKVALGQQPGRIELSLTPNPQAENIRIPLIDLSRGLDFFERALTRVNDIPDAIRLSCVVNRYKEAESLEDLRSIFYNVIGFESAIPEAIDLAFQINRRTKFSNVLGNRVTTINVLETQNIRMVGSSIPEFTTEYGLGTMYDFNTVPDSNVLSAIDQKRVFMEIFTSIKKALASDDLSFLKE